MIPNKKRSGMIAAPFQFVEKVCLMQTFLRICGRIEKGDANAGTRKNGSRCD